MTIDYATQISPCSTYIENLGHIKSPKLADIWNPSVTYAKYNLWLSFLLMKVSTYCEKINKDFSEEYARLSDDERNCLNMFDIITIDKKLQIQYQIIFNFFIEENIIWDDNKKLFLIYIGSTENDVSYVGAIHRENFDELCGFILQLCGIDQKKSEPEMKFKSKIAKEIWELTHKNKKEKANQDMELPNIISAVSAMDESLNMVNIWQLTVGQLYDQFQRLLSNSFYKISSTSVSVWGDEKGKFDNGAWYRNYYVSKTE